MVTVRAYGLGLGLGLVRGGRPSIQRVRRPARVKVLHSTGAPALAVTHRCRFD